MVPDGHQTFALVRVMATQGKKARKPNRPPLSDGYSGGEICWEKSFDGTQKDVKLDGKNPRKPEAALGCQSEDRRRIQFSETEKGREGVAIR